MTSDPVSALSISRMDLNMLETGSKIKGRVKAYTLSMMVAYMMGFSRMTSFMIEANWLGLIKGLLTKVTGCVANIRAKVCSHTLMETRMKAGGKTTRDKVRVKWRIKKTRTSLLYTMVIGKTIRSRVTVLTHGLIKLTRVHGKTINGLVRVPVLTIKTETRTLGTLRTTRDMARVHSLSTMAVSTRDSGRTMWNTAMVYTRGEMGQFWWETGITDSMLTDNLLNPTRERWEESTDPLNETKLF